MATAEELANGHVRKSTSGKKSKVGGAGRLSQALGTGAAGASMEWAEVDPRHMAWLVSVATQLGGAVTFGTSRDGGALMVTVLLDSERATKWISPRDVPEDVLQYLAETLDTLKP